jgi:hypothetical protein
MTDAGKLTMIGWLMILSLISGFAMAFCGKPLHASFSVLHKLSAGAGLVFIVLHIATAIRLFVTRPAVLAFVWVFVAAFLAAIVTGSIQSIPSQAGQLWLNLHRASWIIALIACGVVGRMMMLHGR